MIEAITTLGELGRKSRCRGLCACLGTCYQSGYVAMGGEVIWVEVHWGQVIAARAADSVWRDAAA